MDVLTKHGACKALTKRSPYGGGQTLPNATLSTPCPQGCNLETLAGMVSRHWSIKHTFGAARQEVGLDNCEVRNAADCMDYAMPRA